MFPSPLFSHKISYLLTHGIRHMNQYLVLSFAAAMEYPAPFIAAVHPLTHSLCLSSQPTLQDNFSNPPNLRISSKLQPIPYYKVPYLS